MRYYIHIPFCRQKCPYCKFALTPVFDEAKKRRYIAHLKREILAYFLSFSAGESLATHQKKVNTIYLGGGTPSALSLDEVREILSAFPSQHIGEPANIEITFECNPEDITEVYLSGLLELGVNRISLGVQSTDNETLKAVHRSGAESIFRALDTIGSVLRTQTTHSLISINTDFILGLPYTKVGATLEGIKFLHQKFPYITHTSVYMLEEGLYPKEWSKLSISEQDMEREYTDICEYFDSLGWNHYEISNWAEPGYECQHNQGYWKHEEYRGFGLSATSFENDRRFSNTSSFQRYYRGDLEDEEILSETSLSLEKIIYDLRTFTLKEVGFREEILEKLEYEKNIKRIDGKIMLTSTGIFRENSILSELIAL